MKQATFTSILKNLNGQWENDTLQRIKQNENNWSDPRHIKEVFKILGRGNIDKAIALMYYPKNKKIEQPITRYPFSGGKVSKLISIMQVMFTKTSDMIASFISTWQEVYKRKQQEKHDKMVAKYLEKNKPSYPLGS